MTRKLIAALIVACAAPALAGAEAPTAGPGASEPSVDQVVARMQAFYEKTRGFDTRFEQRFQQGGMPSRFAGASASGRIRFRKPEGSGAPLMRWDYADGRILLLVGDWSWTFDPDTKQATEYSIDAANLSAAVTFLWGKGRIADEFSIARASRTDLAEGGVPLELVPKKPGQGFSRIFLVVDPETGAVLQSVVLQANGSENRITFVEPKLDAAVAAADFDPDRVFPEGTARIKAVLPGQR